MTHQLLNPHNFTLHYFYIFFKNYNLHLILFLTRLPLLSLSHDYSSLPLSFSHAVLFLLPRLILALHLSQFILSGLSMHSLSQSFSSLFEPISADSPFLPQSTSSKSPFLRISLSQFESKTTTIIPRASKSEIEVFGTELNKFFFFFLFCFE